MRMQPSRLQQATAEIRSQVVHAAIDDYSPEIANALLTEWEANTRGDENPHHQHHIAGLKLTERTAELEAAHARVAFDEHSISAKAKRCAWLCMRARTVEKMEGVCHDQGIEPPPEKKHPVIGRKGRMCAEKWWRRQLHRQYSRKAEAALRELGLVSKRRGLYCSDTTLARHTEQKQRQREMMKEVIAVNDLGDQLTLFDLAKASNANPAIRRAELMTRIRGFEEVADAAGHVGELYTFTTPSRFHAYGTDGVKNVSYQEGLDPREAQKWLRLQWAKIRAKCNRLSIRLYGFRVAEPHHDGTTHWHILLFMQQKHAATVRTVCAAYLLSDSGSEPGASKRRFNAKRVNKQKGTAAGYIAKYIAKNIDGFEVGEDYESGQGEDAQRSSKRVVAWASTWGIRQFQQIGGPPVGVWRELRRISDIDPGWERRIQRGDADARSLRDARNHADQGEWGAFIDALGGIARRRCDLEIRVEKEQTGECNEYGELKAPSAVGVAWGVLTIITRIRQWVFTFFESCAPWTRVNNCTASDFDEYITFAGAGPP